MALNKLGEGRINRLTTTTLAPYLLMSIAMQACTLIPRDEVPSIAGTLDSLDLASLLPQTGGVSRVGREADAHLAKTVHSVRTFFTDRFAERRSYGKSLEGEKLYRKVRDRLMPAVWHQIMFDFDSLFFEIVDGTGSAANSRDCTTIAIPATGEWDNYAGALHNPMIQIRDAVALCGADTLAISRTVADALSQSPKVNNAGSGNAAAVNVMDDDALAKKLMSFCRVSRVLFTRKAYQDGGASQPLNIKYQEPDFACVFNREALLGIPWIEREDKEYEDQSKSSVYLQGEMEMDLIVADPAGFIRFDGMLS